MLYTNLCMRCMPPASEQKKMYCIRAMILLPAPSLPATIFHGIILVSLFFPLS